MNFLSMTLQVLIYANNKGPKSLITKGFDNEQL